MSEIFTLLDMRHCQISSSMCLRLFFFSSHTPWADCYLCNLFFLILWEPYIKERPAWEERTGILNAVFSLRWFKPFCSKNLTSVMHSQPCEVTQDLQLSSCATIQFGVVLLGWCLLLWFGDSFGSPLFWGFGVPASPHRKQKSNVAQ